MKRIAILGGGISGLTAAYELELARQRGVAIDWQLYEASDRLGGILETTRVTTPEGDCILEGGPDGWVSEKPWARELAIDLGLEADLIHSNDATRKTYILREGQLLPIPDAMRLMVPADLDALDVSPLFSAEARRAYAAEPARAGELRAAAPVQDESVASFVLRHFGEEVLNTLAAPLLSGVFGGDVHKLSVRAVMPQFVAMEREYGSLIAALQAKSAASASQPPQPIFTSLRNGMGSLTDALISRLPKERLHLHAGIREVSKATAGWLLRIGLDSVRSCTNRYVLADELIFATPLDITAKLLRPGDHHIVPLLPTDASSAILATFIWPTDLAQTFIIPSGFGFLVPQTSPAGLDPEPSLLACTFVDQKFPHRVPPDARILRAFFGGASANTLAGASDVEITKAALTQLRTILGPIPEPAHTTVRRWPRSLPQYEVGHLNRIAQLESLVAGIGHLTLLGNSFRGVGLPDLIRDARSAVRNLITL